MKILAAMSGGVDSSISIKLLKDSGHEVEGVYMILHDKSGYHEHNIKNVRKVGEYFGIKTEILDLRDEFKKAVYEPFVQIYKNGKTPNPCALCNKFIKLGELLKYTKKSGFDLLSTGHYVRLEDGFLKVAFDESKDQSYFLAHIDPKSLQNMIFPLGNFLKSDIKKIAAQIPQISALATQKESSEICFVPDNYREILSRHFDINQSGIVRDTAGKAIGTHIGYANYTIGQRSGFRIDGAHQPHYVVKINAQNNEIIVSNKEDLAIDFFEIDKFNPFTKLSVFECFCKVRYKSLPIRAKVTLKDDKSKAEVRLKQSAYGIAPGQLAVFYDEDDRVLASGFIL